VDATHFTRPTEVPVLGNCFPGIVEKIEAYIIRGKKHDTGNNKNVKDQGLKRKEKVKT
jgi:hypothetical protein